MALTTTQYSINRTSPRGNNLANALDWLQRALATLPFEREKMIQAKTNPAGGENWAAVATLYGLADADTAQAVFAQIDSVCGALGDPATNPGESTVARA